MNATQRAELDVVPIPVDEQGPVRAMVILRNGEWRTAWGFDGCRRPEVFGPAYARAREATAAARVLNDRGGA